MDVPPLAQYIPSSFELLPELSFPPVYIYRHNGSKLPMACMLGGSSGHVIGAIIFYRHADNTMNMQVEATFAMLGALMPFIESELQKGNTAPSSEVWAKFMENLHIHLSQMRAFTDDGRVGYFLRPPSMKEKEEAEKGEAKKGEVDEEEKGEVDEEEKGEAEKGEVEKGEVDEEETGEVDEEEKEEAEKGEVEKGEVDEEETGEAEKGEEGAEKAKSEIAENNDAELCMICIDRLPDTLVLPCEHRVVCAECSKDLEKSKTAARKICCQCQCPITSVYYPDNSVSQVEK